MLTSQNRCSQWHKGMWALLGTVTLVFLAVPLATAQTKDKDKQPGKDAVKEEVQDAPRPKRPQLIKSGYTRPGNPSDKMKDGKVIPVAWDDDYKGRIIGGTVYFAVYERQLYPVAGDTFGTGITNFDELFREGRSTSGAFSPAFDLNARYLYLYQVVNDRGLDPVKEVPIGFREFRTEDIITSTVKLLVDPVEITSWGHLKDMGFAAEVADRTLRGEIVMAADGMHEKVLPMAFSANPSILAALPYHEYLMGSPEMPLRDLRQTLGVDKSNLNLKNSKAYNDLVALKGNKVELVRWQENMLQAAKGGKEPTYVTIVVPEFDQFGRLVAEYADPTVPPPAGPPARAYLRADWRGENILKLGDHSVVFGMTSNLPPTDDRVRIVSGEKGKPKMVEKEEEPSPVAFVDAKAEAAQALQGGTPGQVGAVGSVAAVGTVPTPAGVGPGMGLGAIGGAGAWFGGLPAGIGPGFGPGFGGGAGVGGVGTTGFSPTAPFVGGGGGTTGGSSGQTPNTPTGSNSGLMKPE